jgi:sec-independent protein translocase protein TatC
MAHRLTRKSDAQPDDARMSFGDHLEELRRRLLYALAGLAAAFIVCYWVGDRIIETLSAPYYLAMRDLGFDEPRMVQLNPIEPFMEYFKICLEFGLVLAAPWVLYQLWLFVAAGLYPHERRVVKRFARWSIVLFLVGASFMVFFVLFGLMKFLINFGTWYPIPAPDNPLYRWLHPADVRRDAPTSQPAAPPLHVPVLSEDPAHPSSGDVWINRDSRRLIVSYDGQTYFAPLQKAGNRQFVQPLLSISQYLDFVVNLALAFGLGFQIPIVVVLVVLLGIVEARQIAQARRYVILAIVVLSAFITPTPDVATMLLLAVPMQLLFEAGLAIARIVERSATAPEGSAPTD